MNMLSSLCNVSLVACLSVLSTAIHTVDARSLAKARQNSEDATYQTVTATRAAPVILAASPDAADGPAPQKSNTVAIGLGVVSALLIVGLIIFGWWYIRRRRAAQGFVKSAKIDASFAIEEAAPPPLPASELRKLSQRPSLGVITVPEKLTEEALKRNMSTVTRSDVSHQPMSPALASSVMEYAPYGAPSRVLRNPSSAANGSKKNRASRSSRYRSLVYGPNTAVTEQSIAELQEELPIPPTPKSAYSTVSTARNLPPPPPPMPVKEDKPMRVVRASDLPPPPPLPTAAADLVGSSSPLPSIPSAPSLQVPSNRGGRRLPTLPGSQSSSEAGPSSQF